MKKVVKTIAAVCVLGAAIVACEKEEVEVNETENLTENSGEQRMSADIAAVPYGPDLVVTFVNSDLPIVSPSGCGAAAQQPTCGNQYTLTVRVTNIGNAPTTDYYDIEMDKPTGSTVTNIFTSPSNSLAPGASDTFIIGPVPFGGCSGTFSRQSLIITADVFDAIRETNETNNTARPYQYCGD